MGGKRRHHKPLSRSLKQPSCPCPPRSSSHLVLGLPVLDGLDGVAELGRHCDQRGHLDTMQLGHPAAPPLAPDHHLRPIVCARACVWVRSPSSLQHERTRALTHPPRVWQQVAAKPAEVFARRGGEGRE